MYQFNTRDLKIIQQVKFNIRLKIDVYDERTNDHLETLECGLISGSISINSDSDIRRQANIECVPIRNKRLRLEKDSIIWINRKIKLHIGLYDIHYRKWNYYPVGVFFFSNYGATYDAITNTISLSLVDSWCNFDGSRNGFIGGSEKIVYPAYEEDSETGEVIKYNHIRDAVITTLLQLGKLSESQLMIDEMGEYKAMPEYNPNYLEYREQSKVETLSGVDEMWSAIPFDQEFSCGCSVSEILTTFRDLYPNYEMFFTEDEQFVCQMIPSCYDDDIIFDYDFFDKIYISENTSVDLTTVKNVCEVWGKSIETDFYTEDCVYEDNCYVCNVEAYEEKYYNGDKIAVKIPTSNQSSCSINVNGFGAISIFDENTEKPIKENLMEAEQVYVFKIKKKHVNDEDVIRVYLLGQYQPHSLCVLTDGSMSTEDYVAQDGIVVKKYSKEYFQKLFNCKTITFKTIKDSPFTIQKIGQFLKVCVGGEFENITSDSLASARADYEIYKSARLTDNISITTKLVLFADVNIKVSYRRRDTGQIEQYIVKNITHDLNGTTTWNLVKFYPLYENSLNLITGTHEILSSYTHRQLANYTHKQLTTLKFI